MAELLTVDWPLEKFADHIRDDHLKAARAMGVIAETLHSYVMDVFEAEGQVGPHPRWDPLKPSTERKRRSGKNKSKGNKILQDTTIMITSVERSYGDTFAEVYSDSPYLGYHRTGVPAGSAERMAKRDPYQIDDEEFQADANDLFMQFFKRRH